MSDLKSVTREEVLDWLQDVKDPEIPVLSVVELGVVRSVDVTVDGIVVEITPTYSGCPALEVMETEIAETIRARGIEPVQVRVVFREPWTTDWMSEAARDKLRAYGIAPPAAGVQQLVSLSRRLVVACPVCGSTNTTQKSEFGSTSCKALFVCSDCREPFDYFKAI